MEKYFIDSKNNINWIEANSLSESGQKRLREKLNTWNEPGIDRYIIGRSKKELGDLLFATINSYNKLFVAQQNGVHVATLSLNPIQASYYKHKLTEHIEYLKSGEMEIENVLSLESATKALSMADDSTFFSHVNFFIVAPEFQNKKIARSCFNSLGNNLSFFSAFEPVITSSISKSNSRSVKATEASGSGKIITNDYENLTYCDYMFVKE